MSRKSQVTPARKPVTPALQIEYAFLSETPSPVVNSYHADCVEWERTCDARNASVRGLIENINDATVGDVLHDAIALDNARRELRTDYVALLWKRKEVVAAILPAAERAAAQAAMDHGQTKAAENERLRNMGVQMSAAGVNTNAEAIQFDKYVDQLEIVLASAAKAKNAVSALESVRNGIVKPVGLNSSTLNLPSAFDAVVAYIQQRTPSPAAAVQLSRLAQQVFGEVGMENVALLPEHIDTGERIAGIIEKTKLFDKCRFRFAHGLPQKAVDQIVPLLKKLPPNAKRDKAICDVQDYATGLVNTPIAAANLIDGRPRVSYSDGPRSFEQYVTSNAG